VKGSSRARAEHGQSDIGRSHVCSSFVRSLIPSRFVASYSSELCVYTDQYVSVYTCALGVPISKIATLANEVTLYNRGVPSIVLNEIG